MGLFFGSMGNRILWSQIHFCVNLVDLMPEFVERAVSVNGFFHIAAQTVSHEHMLGEIIHGILVAEPREGMPAVVGRVFFPGTAVKNIQFL